MDKQRVICVIDLKAFYAYVECLDRGLDPWKTPLIVADKERGKNTIILSVSPYLKSKGVPSRLRVKELPKGFNYIYATPRMNRYIEKSSEVVNIMLDFVSEEDMHVYSIDESFIDLTPYLNYYKKSPFEIVKMIMDTIKDKTGLMATAGIGDNFFLAKVALDVYAKQEKDGIATLHKEDVAKKLWPITPLRDIWGIGSHYEYRLNAMGIYNVYELAHADREYFRNKFGIMGEQLIDHANGIDESDIREIYEPKETSLTLGSTLHRDYSISEFPLLLKELNDDLSMKLRDQNQLTSVVSLFVGYSSNQGGFHHQASLQNPSNDTDELYKVLLALFNKYKKDLPIRQVSINYGKLRLFNGYEQLDMFTSIEMMDRKRALQGVVDLLHKKYGKDIILRASALTDISTAKERHSQIGGHRK